ncbi:MAG: phosphoribosylformylglycinamidine synthase subunit PurL [Planctomycetota bacterium]
MPLWQIDIHPTSDQADRSALQIQREIHELGLGDDLHIASARGFLIEGELDQTQADEIAATLLADQIVETTRVAICGDESLAEPPEPLIESLVEAGIESDPTMVTVLTKAGVMDPVAASTLAALSDLGVDASGVRTLRKCWISGASDLNVETICKRALSNDSIERFVIGDFHLDSIDAGQDSSFELITTPIRGLDDAALDQLSKTGQLYLTTVEMRTIRDAFEQLGRDPTDIELESIAQTWSEHCSHKTLAGRIHYRGPKVNEALGVDGAAGSDERQFDNMLKETIFAATQTIRKQLGDDDWCVSVFKDNAGVVTFDDEDHVCFKVETHNHPSALEPYGGANTGIGGVIRDPMGTGLGARPVCNTDVFCFAPPDISTDELPAGVLHPRRVIQGVVAGVRDYGNRMGIPTVNGAIYFDPRYLGNPLVYAGNVGIMPVGSEEKQVRANDYIVAIGGRTGRDGIHGATFSSAELTSDSESLSGGAVQIGNAITEKMVLDVLMQARDRGLFNAVTDCGAGGFSSAVGEMGEDIGAEVWLEKAPLKYEGLTYTEIWISEAQERMVLSVSPEQWGELEKLCASEGVEAARIGRFVPTGRLHLTYHGETVGDLSMSLLHDGRPPVVREATYQAPSPVAVDVPQLSAHENADVLHAIMGSLNVASKHWVIRQYDHEVQAGSVVKPLVGPLCDGPSDAAVIRPKLTSSRGLVISCGMNPHYGDFDTYHMATSAIDEAIRNAVAVGADPTKIAILDNFCWGYTDRPETLGSLVRAAIACQDLAVTLGTPFISGKDSLNNEFSTFDEAGTKQTIAIPPSLLISAMGQIDDVSHAVTMDLKTPGNRLYLIGKTQREFGGSHFGLVRDCRGGDVPRVNGEMAKAIFAAVHHAISKRWIRSAHDCSEGGLAVTLAEMAMAGGLGMELNLASALNGTNGLNATELCFAESNSRFVVEVPATYASVFEAHFDSKDLPLFDLGTVTEDDQLTIANGDESVMQISVSAVKSTWLAPLDW